MKLIVLAVVALAAVALASPVNPQVQILRSDFVQQPDGPYNFNYETEDGSKRDETGEIKIVNDEENKPQPVLTVRGSYSYVDSENKPHIVNYYADENGYHAEGADIPQA